MQRPIQVNDSRIIRMLSDLIDNSLDDSSSTLNSDWLKERAWIAFPLPGDRYEPWEPDTEVHNMMAGITALGIEKFLAANVDFPDTDPEFAWQAEVTTEDLMGISNELGGWPFLLTDPAVSFLIYCTNAEYHIVAGPPDFVLRALGGDLEKAKADFIEQAATVWGGGDERRLLRVLGEHEDLLTASGYPLKSPKKKHRTTFWYISIHPKGAEEEIDVIPLGVDFALYSAQSSFGRSRDDLMTGTIPIHQENLKFAWTSYCFFEFEKFDYFLMSYEP